MATISFRPPVSPQNPALQKQKQQQQYPSKPTDAGSKTGDETLATYNCDDSMTQDSSSQHTNKSSSFSQQQQPSQQLFRPPVAAVNVDTRNVRQRLRDQEAKINSLLHSTTSHANKDTNTLLKLVKTLEDDLQKTESEKQHLHEQLHQKQTQQQQQQKQQQSTASAAKSEATALLELQKELQEKNHSLAYLQNRLDSTLERLVQSQLDLETHNLHYTDYAKVQFETGQAALEDMNELTKSSDKATRKLGKRSKQMMTTLLTDLEALGKRYQQQHLEHEATVTYLEEQQSHWKNRAESLEQRLEALGEDVAAIAPLPPSTAVDLNRQRQATVAQETLTKLQQQLEVAQTEKQQAQLGQQAMQCEVTRLQKAVEQLQDVTVKQQEELEAIKNKKKKKGLFGLKKSKKANSIPSVDIHAALAPIREESHRFDEVQAQFDSYASQMAQQRQREASKTAQIKEELAELRLKEAKDTSSKETELEVKLAMAEAQLAESQAQREQEKAQSQDKFAKLEARIAELESSC